jgi:hypothetical protein
LTLCDGGRGFIAGAIGAVATSPIDAIKTKLQVKEGGKRAGENFMSITMEFVRAEGIGAFTRVQSKHLSPSPSPSTGFPLAHTPLFLKRSECISPLSSVSSHCMPVSNYDDTVFFLQGIGARVLWIAPGSAIAIAFFELFQGEMTRNWK